MRLMGIAEFSIGPAEGRTRWLHPSRWHDVIQRLEQINRHLRDRLRAVFLFAGHLSMVDRCGLLCDSRSDAKVSPHPEVESKRAAISSQTDLSGRDHYRDGRLDLAIVVWDKVAGRQTLNCFEARSPLAKEEMPARPSSALTPASPQRRLLESWSSAPHPFHLSGFSRLRRFLTTM